MGGGAIAGDEVETFVTTEADCRMIWVQLFVYFVIYSFLVLMVFLIFSFYILFVLILNIKNNNIYI